MKNLPWPNAQVYRSGLWADLFCFYSLALPDRVFHHERELFALAKTNPQTVLPGESNRFGYPKGFIGPLPSLAILSRGVCL